MSPHVNIGGIKINYEEYGTGDPLVLLHGLTLSGSMWKPQIEEFSGHYRLLVPDLRGHGKSDAPEKGYTFHEYAEDIRRLLDRLRVDKAHIVGLSMGGAVATEFTLTHPGRVISTVVISSLPPRVIPESSWNKVIDRFREVMKNEGARKAVEEVLLKNSPLGKLKLKLNDWSVIKESMHGFSGMPILAEQEWENNSLTALGMLPMIQTPFLIITGENDEPIFHKTADTMHGAVKGSKRFVISGAGHLCTMEKPLEVNAEILKFLRQVKNRR